MANLPSVYALGRIEPRFPSLASEKNSPRRPGAQKDRQTLRTVLSEGVNRYLARQLCWTLTIEGMETYVLHPRDPADLDLLLKALRPTPGPMDVDVVVGVRGPVAPPHL